MEEIYIEKNNRMRSSSSPGHTDNEDECASGSGDNFRELGQDFRAGPQHQFSESKFPYALEGLFSFSGGGSSGHGRMPQAMIDCGRQATSDAPTDVRNAPSARMHESSQHVGSFPAQEVFRSGLVHTYQDVRPLHTAHDSKFFPLRLLDTAMTSHCFKCIHINILYPARQVHLNINDNKNTFVRM